MKTHPVRRLLLLLALPSFVAACGPATPPPEDQAPPPPLTGTIQPNDSVPDEVVDPPVPPAEQDAFLDLFLTQEELGPQYGLYEDVRTAMPDASEPVMSVYHLERAGRMVWMGRSDEPVWLVFDLLRGSRRSPARRRSATSRGSSPARWRVRSAASRTR
jgi:hypothetical protein